MPVGLVKIKDNDNNELVRTFKAFNHCWWGISMLIAFWGEILIKNS